MGLYGWYSRTARQEGKPVFTWAKVSGDGRVEVICVVRRLLPPNTPPTLLASYSDATMMGEVVPDGTIRMVEWGDVTSEELDTFAAEQDNHAEAICGGLIED